MATEVLIACAFFGIALLYSSVGHGGGSGYLAVLALLTSLPQQEMKATALVLNVLVASIGTWRFVRAGHFAWGTFWPLAVLAVPMAFVGGVWELPPAVFGPLIGGVLLFAAWRLGVAALREGSVGSEASGGRGDGEGREGEVDGGSTEGSAVGGAIERSADREARMPRLWVACVSGGVLGLMAGLTGTGGGIFLSPLLLLMGWASAKRTAAVSVVFVLVNSASGLAGVVVDGVALGERAAGDLGGGVPLPGHWWVLAIGAVGGGLVGSWLGARRLPGKGIRLLLAGMLVLAAVKMVF